MNKPAIQIDQCQIDAFQSISVAFLQVVLALDRDKVMLTDLSDLSDFCYSGDLPAGLLDTGRAPRELVATWDKWVITRVQEHYGITLTTTMVNLVWLFNQIELSQTAQVH
jgi:hypothetical protein